MRLRAGRELVVIDLSNGGALVEGATRLLPGTHVDVHVITRDGRTLVPLNMYFNDRGIAKMALALAKGRKAPDKRAADAKRDWDRQKARLLRDRG